MSSKVVAIHLVVALLMDGQWDKGIELLGLLSKKLAEKQSEDTYIATCGLFLILMGHMSEGRKYYDLAIKSFKARGQNKSAAIALLFYSRAVGASDRVSAKPIESEALKLAKKHGMSEVINAIEHGWLDFSGIRRDHDVTMSSSLNRHI